MQAEPHPETAVPAALRERLSHVYWIGGGPGGGKSTTSRRLAARYGLTVYATDDVMGDHFHRTTVEDAPLTHQFAAMSMDQRWLDRSPETMLETFHWFRGEGFDLIVEDLLRLPKEPGVIVEGFRLLPHLVKPLLKEPSQAVWLLPTPDFRQAAFVSRDYLWEIPRKTSNPQQTFHNLRERDRMFTERTLNEARGLHLPAIQVHPGLTEDELERTVAKSFAL